MVTVVNGTDVETAELDGRTVSDIRSTYASVFNIGDDSFAKVNGKEVGEDYVVKDGDKVIFDKKADKYVN